MKTFTPEEIQEVLRLHQLWLAGSPEGERANLFGAYLCHADLCHADLRHANLFGADLRHADLSGANLRSVDLRHANLCYANLRNADLWGCVGNGSEIKSLQCGGYPVTYTAEVLQIGCQQHAINDWWQFNADEIDEMDQEATEWWGVWRPLLESILAGSPATPVQVMPETEES